MVDANGSVTDGFVDPRPEYWSEYSNLQKVKHDLIRAYCNGWFPKLGLWAGLIAYLDTHAGRGTYAAGQLGSPLVALDTFLKHTSRDRILTKSKVAFIFIERDNDNARALESELEHRQPLPNGVSCQVLPGDCFAPLRQLIERFKQPGHALAPAFVFIDPYGFKVPGAILRELMGFPRVELFVNVIWRELDMAMRQPDKMGPTLDLIFDGREWREQVTADDYDERAHQTIKLLRDLMKARWATYVRMLGPNDATRYVLVHFTNHDAGRDLMKDCIWKVCPAGGFYARKSDDPAQEYLIKPQPDLSPLRSWAIEKLRESPRRWKDLQQAIRGTLWRVPHLNRVVRELHADGVIEGRDYSGKFSGKANPELYFRGDK